MGFRFNVAPSIMRAIVEATHSKDDAVRQATSAYIDDVFINKDVVSATRVRQQLANFGLTSKEPERLQNGARVLGLTVQEESKMLIWEQGNEAPSMLQVRTRRSVSSFCGKLVEHFPEVKWLKVAASFIKRRAADITKGWDDEVTDVPLTTMITEVVAKVRQEDPVRGKWCVDGPELDVWVDASSLATGVSLKHNGAVMEDASWLRNERDTQHINLAELDAVLKGVNMALMWEATILHIHTDSACVHKWVTDTLTGKARVRTREASEMLIRRRLDALASLVKEYGLSVDAVLVRSEHNRADSLTRVQQRWFDLARKAAEPPYCESAVSPSKHDFGWIRSIHHRSSHPGVRRTLYFIRLVDPTVSKASVRTVVRNCKKCQSIDPPPSCWPRGELDFSDTWSRVGMDVTHYQGRHYLSLIDCGPSRFSIWRHLRRQDAASVVSHLESLFCECNSLAEILVDNDTAFRSKVFRDFLSEWGVRLHFRCAHVPSGNGIVERCHWRVKQIAARKQCPIMEAVYWYNATPKDNVSPLTAPVNLIYRYRVRLKGIDALPPDNPKQQQIRYEVGYPVWMKTPNRRCTSPYASRRVTGVISPQNVLVDGMPSL